MHESKFRLREDVRYRVVGNEAVVVRQEAAEVIALNDVGARVLELMSDERCIAEIVEALIGVYDVDRSTLESDVETFVGEIVEAGILEERLPSAIRRRSFVPGTTTSYSPRSSSSLTNATSTVSSATTTSPSEENLCGFPTITVSSRT